MSSLGTTGLSCLFVFLCIFKVGIWTRLLNMSKCLLLKIYEQKSAEICFSHKSQKDHLYLCRLLQLRNLNVLDLRHISELNNETVMEVVRKCRNLSSLNLCLNWSINDR